MKTFRNLFIAILIVTLFTCYEIQHTPKVEAFTEETETTQPMPTVQPTANPKEVMTIKSVEYIDKGNPIDELVDKYSQKYSYSSVDKYSQLKATLHCLLYFESKHTAANGKGDNGLASGPLQFHQETYVNFRKIMIKKGLVKEIGSRDNLENAIETTAWALSDGRGMNWGPILRGECVNPR